MRIIDKKIFLKSKDLSFNSKIIIYLSFLKNQFLLEDNDITLISENKTIDINETSISLKKKFLQFIDRQTFDSDVLHYIYHQDISSDLFSLNKSNPKENDEQDLLKNNIINWTEDSLTQEERIIFYIKYYKRLLSNQDLSQLFKLKLNRIKSITFKARSILALSSNRYDINWEEYIKKIEILNSLESDTKLLAYLRFYKKNYYLSNNQVNQLVDFDKSTSTSLMKKPENYIKNYQSADIIYFIYHPDIYDILKDLVKNPDYKSKDILTVKKDIVNWIRKNLTNKEKILFLLKYYNKGLLVSEISEFLNMKISDIENITKNISKKIGQAKGRHNFDWDSFIKRNEDKFLKKLYSLKHSIKSPYIKKLCTEDVIIDIYHNSLVVLSDKLGKDEDIEYPLSWMYKVIVNIFSNWKNKIHHMTESIESEDEESGRYGSNYTPMEEHKRDMMLDTFRKCIKSHLNFDAKLTIYFRYYKQHFSLTEEEIEKLTEGKIKDLSKVTKSIEEKIPSFFNQNPNIGGEVSYFLWFSDLTRIIGESNNPKKPGEETIKRKIFEWAFYELTEDERIIFFLKYYLRDLNITEVAKVLNKTKDNGELSLDSVKSVSKRARNDLSDCFNFKADWDFDMGIGTFYLDNEFNSFKNLKKSFINSLEELNQKDIHLCMFDLSNTEKLKIDDVKWLFAKCQEKVSSNKNGKYALIITEELFQKVKQFDIKQYNPQFKLFYNITDADNWIKDS